MGSVPSLTGIRGVAALWVVLYHIQLIAPDLHLPFLSRFTVLGWGWTAVDLFFVLSGFILMHAHGAEFARLRPARLLRFARTRFLRVYPLNLAVLSLIGALLIADPGFAAWYRQLRPGNLSPAAFWQTALLATRWFLPRTGDVNAPVWSLSVEVLGYAGFPFLARALQSRHASWLRPVLLLGGFALLALYRVWTATATNNDLGQIGSVIRMACCFTAGAALHGLRIRAPGWLRPWAGTIAGCCCGALLLCCIRPAFALAIPPLFVLLIFALSFQTGWVNRLLASRPAVFLGRISFPLYLLHLMPLLWLRHHIAAQPHNMPAALAIIIGFLSVNLLLATILNYVVERPAHRWGKRGRRTNPRMNQASQI